ncbi:uncharacterized protein Bfra_010371 [Botrytis fragariae]|uniref:Uncharacterized protein n=1 Tax=Botrytis fragariae TaxID=1964551 RepID=A0A8H6EFQ4_9HELO|nr:uncharacterized protein Bfra_010371 [Botrytis fragariae]KAF5870225.1 hypothetical protein Bfra_010371 [Botrytis fragariae]
MESWSSASTAMLHLPASFLSAKSHGLGSGSTTLFENVDRQPFWVIIHKSGFDRENNLHFLEAFYEVATCFEGCEADVRLFSTWKSIPDVLETKTKYWSMVKNSKDSIGNPDDLSAFVSPPRGTTALTPGSPMINPYITSRNSDHRKVLVLN